MDNTKNTKENASIIARKQVSYGEALAYSLILYAENDEALSETLSRRLVSKKGSYKQAQEVPALAGILMPQNRQQAIRRAEWMFKAMEMGTVHEAEKAEAVLHAWNRTREQEEPKQLVVGVVVVAVPGVTMGKFKVKKKMNIIVREDIATGKSSDLAQKATQASSEIVSVSLKMAKGNAGRMEPDLAEWFWGERILSFYTTKKDRLTGIEKDLKELDVPFSSIEDEKGPAVVAVTPAADTKAQEIYWDIEPLK